VNLSPVLERFFRTQAVLNEGDALVVAFSGGPDSTALLIGLREFSDRRAIRLHPVHLDHGLDPDSAERAAAASRICSSLGFDLEIERRPPATPATPESREAGARRRRYEFLEECRQRHRARWIATAHHRDDQLETVLLRILFGSGVAGLAGIPAVRGRIVRPVLDLSRRDLRAVCSAAGLIPVRDDTNLDQNVPRNRLRHTVLPRLERADPGLATATLATAAAAGRARDRIDRYLQLRLEPRVEEDTVRVRRSLLASLPHPLWPFALAQLHRLAGANYPPPEAARRELRRQLGSGRHVGCDCGDGWRWTTVGSDLLLARHREKTADFTYTLEAPGEIEIPELGVEVRLFQGPIAAWMMRGSSTRAGLALPIAVGDRLTIRNRRPGDRIQPLGCSYRRRLKDVLIDRRIPRWERDRLPLLCVGDRIAWVPGVTVDESFRLETAGIAWIAELR